MNGLFTVADFKKKAEEVSKDSLLFTYFKHGAEKEITLKHNENIFRELYILPKCLVDVSNVNMNTKIFGCEAKWPVGISPSANHKQAHNDGEIGTAKAAGNVGSIFILSSFSMTSFEDVAVHAPNTIKWLQMYIYKDRNFKSYSHPRNRFHRNFLTTLKIPRPTINIL
ncbi:HAO1.2 family protein [Megaselia abdita]